MVRGVLQKRAWRRRALAVGYKAIKNKALEVQVRSLRTFYRKSSGSDWLESYSQLTVPHSNDKVCWVGASDTVPLLTNCSPHDWNWTSNHEHDGRLWCFKIECALILQWVPI